MNIGVNNAVELKEISEARNVPFADLLHAYAVEDLIRRIYKSSYAEHFWLLQEDGQNLEEIALNPETRMDFFYIKGSRNVPSDKLVPGQVLSKALVEEMAKDFFFSENKYGVSWLYQIDAGRSSFRLRLTAVYKDMQVPISIRIAEQKEEGQRAVKVEIPTIMNKNKTIFYYSYSPENLISEHIFEIMRKLELIGDMKSYSVVNDILRTQSISGRYILDELSRIAEQEPKVVKPKRMEQIQGYREYAYMRKRWEQYCKNNGKEVEPWSEVLDRVVSFLQPIWKCLCNNEIFFDDWMPELGRYLG